VILSASATSFEFLDHTEKLRRKDFRFVTTHLEGFDPVQAQQATELVQGPGNTNLPVIWLEISTTTPLASFAVPGCSSPGGSPATNPAHNVIASGGFADAWTILHPSDSGFSWPLHCEDPFTPSAIERRNSCDQKLCRISAALRHALNSDRDFVGFLMLRNGTPET
jgi:hypothetical protein